MTIEITQRDTFGNSLPQMNRDMYVAGQALEEGNWTKAARHTGRMCLIIERYRGNAGDSQAGYNTFDNHIIPGIIGRLIETA